MEITDSTPAQTHLRTLEFVGDIKCWRGVEPNTDSIDDEDETAQERQQRKETENQDRLFRLPTRLPNILKTVLPALSNLAKLTIGMDSSIETLDPSAGSYTSPRPMDESDLLALLALLPSSTEKLRLLRLRDSRARPLGALVEERLVTGEIAAGACIMLSGMACRNLWFRCLRTGRRLWRRRGIGARRIGGGSEWGWW